MCDDNLNEIGDYVLFIGWYIEYQGYGVGVFQCVDKIGLMDDGGIIVVGFMYVWKCIIGLGDVIEFGVVLNVGSVFDNKVYILVVVVMGVFIFLVGDIYMKFFIFIDMYIVCGNLINLYEINDLEVIDFIVYCLCNEQWDGRIDGILWEGVNVYFVDGYCLFYIYFIMNGNMWDC